ncbi:MAG TPA: hypothetical protein P5550_12455, partial [Bacteroidales bacterium]|nr:hypothetical protein [Bacteroidales bacterium]
TNPNGRGQTVILEVPAGPSMNYPLMAVWLEDLGGNYLQTLYVAQSIATGTFRHGKQVKGHWEPGERRRPAALPRWGHQRGLQASDGLYLPEPSQPVPDAYTGATPTTAFRLKAKADQPLEHPVRIFLEINQSWDWNTFWTNAKYPGDEAYATSSQPAVVYSAVLDPSRPGEKVGLSLAGRSHHSGTDGLLYKDVETLSTALQIIGEASARIVD